MSPLDVLASGGIDPGPLAAWAGLIVAVFAIVAGVVAGITAAFRWFVIPQLARLVDQRVDVAERAFAAAIRRLHDRIDTHLDTH